MSTAVATSDHRATGSNALLVTMSVMAATVMQALDTTIANVALPHMQGALGATQDQISWVLTSYIVAAAIFMPLTGFLTERLGRKRLFTMCVAGFTITSMLCGAAQSLEEMVIFRLLQGVCGAALVPLSQAVLLDTYPKEKHGQAMAMWGVGVMVGPILGPFLGGWLTEYYDWRWVFYINVPVGVFTWFALTAFMEETPLDNSRRFDFTGFLFLAIALGALQMMLDRGETLDWFNSSEVIVESLITAFAFYLFVAHIFTHKSPFIEPAIFKDRNFSISLIFIFIVGIVLLATIALLPPFMQSLMGYSVMDVGTLLAPRGMGTMVAMMLVGRLSGKVDPRHLIFVGLCLTSLSLWEMTYYTTLTTQWEIVRNGVIQGFGLGFVFVPLSAVAFSTMQPQYRGIGTALFSLLRNIGSSIGISVVVTYLAHRSQINHGIFASYITPFSQPLNQAVSSGALDTSTLQGIAAINGKVTEQALTLAYLQDFRLMMFVTLVAMPLLLFMRGPQANVNKR
ncbi:DHA2 family efflux MFS transporter permease subunit [Teredinibacter turnerae]|uniref:DHA2 family efflux MFS transporter permease subunit n=1 Tax=Teredinibacter turnerae TaxID=2426 RepID=UPI00035FF48E|nr:DHA2 family efflux MFS transporter permease subunit [Teredinibacter turnerae]